MRGHRGGGDAPARRAGATVPADERTRPGAVVGDADVRAVAPGAVAAAPAAGRAGHGGRGDGGAGGGGGVGAAVPVVGRQRRGGRPGPRAVPHRHRCQRGHRCLRPRGAGGCGRRRDAVRPVHPAGRRARAGPPVDGPGRRAGTGRRIGHGLGGPAHPRRCHRQHRPGRSRRRPARRRAVGQRPGRVRCRPRPRRRGGAQPGAGGRAAPGPPALPGSGPASEPAAEPATAPVAGVYEDLAGRDLGDYWCSLGPLFLLQGVDPVPPPPVLVADRETFLDLVTAMDDAGAGGQWQAPLGEGTTLAGVDHLVDDLACGTPDESRLSWCEGVVYGPDGVSRFGDARGLPPERWRDADAFVDAVLETSLPFVRERGRSIRTSVAGGVVPVAGFAALAGVGLVGAAGALWFDRRRREVTLLTVRGVSPAALGVKAVLELGLAAGGRGRRRGGAGLPRGALARTVAGDRAGGGGGRGAGRGGQPGARRAASSAPWSPGGCGRTTAGAGSAGWLRFVPWELGLAGAAVVSYRRLGEWGVPVSAGARRQPGRRARACCSPCCSWWRPLAVRGPGARACASGRCAAAAPGGRRRCTWRCAGWPATGCAVIGPRGGGRRRRRRARLRRRRSTARSTPRWRPRPRRSWAATSPCASATRLELPDGIADRSTTVDVYRRGVGRRAPARRRSCWRSTRRRSSRPRSGTRPFADVSLDEILDRLDDRPPRRGGPRRRRRGRGPGAHRGRGRPTSGTTRFPIELVADVDGLPGHEAGRRHADRVPVGGRRPRPAPAHDDRGVDRRRPGRLARRAARRRASRSRRTARSATVVDQAAFLTVSWTFGFMQSLGVAAGVLVVGGIAVYLDARRRDRVLGYAFARRMGLAPAPAPPGAVRGAGGERRDRLLARPRHRGWPGPGSPTTGSTRCPASGPTPCSGPRSRSAPSLAVAAVVVAAVARRRRPSAGPTATTRWRCSVPGPDAAASAAAALRGRVRRLRHGLGRGPRPAHVDAVVRPVPADRRGRPLGVGEVVAAAGARRAPAGRHRAGSWSTAST